jgi:hypothetical protein
VKTSHGHRRSYRRASAGGHGDDAACNPSTRARNTHDRCADHCRNSYDDCRSRNASADEAQNAAQSSLARFTQHGRAAYLANTQKKDADRSA